MDESLALGVIAEQLGVPVDSLSAETAFADLNATLWSCSRLLLHWKKNLTSNLIMIEQKASNWLAMYWIILQSWLRQRKKNKYEPSESGRI